VEGSRLGVQWRHEQTYANGEAEDEATSRGIAQDDVTGYCSLQTAVLGPTGTLE
jgi:hypothetical protein